MSVDLDAFILYWNNRVAKSDALPLRVGDILLLEVYDLWLAYRTYNKQANVQSMNDCIVDAMEKFKEDTAAQLNDLPKCLASKTT